MENPEDREGKKPAGQEKNKRKERESKGVNEDGGVAETGGLDCFSEATSKHARGKGQGAASQEVVLNSTKPTFAGPIPQKRKQDEDLRVKVAAAEANRGEGRAPGGASSPGGQTRFPEGGVSTVPEGNHRQGSANASPRSPKKPVLKIQKRLRRDPPTTVSPVAEAPGTVGATTSPLAADRWLMQGVGGNASAGTGGADVSAAAKAVGGRAADVSNREGLADRSCSDDGQKHAKGADSGLRPDRQGGLNGRLGLGSTVQKAAQSLDMEQSKVDDPGEVPKTCGRSIRGLDRLIRTEGGKRIVEGAMLSPTGPEKTSQSGPQKERPPAQLFTQEVHSKHSPGVNAPPKPQAQREVLQERTVRRGPLFTPEEDSARKLGLTAGPGAETQSATPQKATQLEGGERSARKRKPSPFLAGGEWVLEAERRGRRQARLSDAQKGNHSVSKRNRGPEQPLAGGEKDSLEAREDRVPDGEVSGAPAVGGRADSLEDRTAVGREHGVSKRGTVFASSVGEAQTPEVMSPEKVGADEELAEVGGGQIAKEERQSEEQTQTAGAPGTRASDAWTGAALTAGQESGVLKAGGRGKSGRRAAPRTDQAGGRSVHTRTRASARAPPAPCTPGPGIPSAAAGGGVVNPIVLDSSEDEDDAPTPPKLPSPAPRAARHVPCEPLGPAHPDRPSGELHLETEEGSVERVGPFVETLVSVGMKICDEALDEGPGGATEMGRPAGEHSPTRTPEPATRHGAESVRTPEPFRERPILRAASVTDPESIPLLEGGSLGVAEQRKEALVAPESASGMGEREAHDDSSDSDDVPIGVRNRMKNVEDSTTEGFGGGNNRPASQAEAEKQHNSARKKTAGRHARGVGGSILPGGQATAGTAKPSARDKKADSRGRPVGSEYGAREVKGREGSKRRGAQVKKGEKGKLAVLALRAPPRSGMERGGEVARGREGDQEEVAAWANGLLEEPESEAKGSQADRRSQGNRGQTDGVRTEKTSATMEDKQRAECKDKGLNCERGSKGNATRPGQKNNVIGSLQGEGECMPVGEAEQSPQVSQRDACPKEGRGQELGGGDKARREAGAASGDEVLAEKGDSGRTFGAADGVTGRKESGAIGPAEWGGAADIPLDRLTRSAGIGLIHPKEPVTLATSAAPTRAAFRSLSGDPSAEIFEGLAVVAEAEMHGGGLAHLEEGGGGPADISPERLTRSFELGKLEQNNHTSHHGTSALEGLSQPSAAHLSEDLSGGIPRALRFGSSHDLEQVAREGEQRQGLDSGRVQVCEAQQMLESRPEPSSGECLQSGHVADGKWPESKAQRFSKLSQPQRTIGEGKGEGIGGSREAETSKRKDMEGLSTHRGSAQEERGALRRKMEDGPQSIGKLEEWFIQELGMLFCEPYELVCRKVGGIAFDAIMGRAAGCLKALARVLSEVENLRGVPGGQEGRLVARAVAQLRGLKEDAAGNGAWAKELDEELHERERELTAARKRNEHLEREKNERGRELAALRRREEELEQEGMVQATAAARGLEEAKMENRKAQEASKGRIEELSGEVARGQRAMDELEGRLKKGEEEREKLQAVLEDSWATVEELEQRLDDVEKKAAEEKTAMENSLARMKGEVDRLQAEKAVLEERVRRENEEARAKLVGSERRAAEERTAMENSFTALRGELGKVRAENSELEERIGRERKEGEAKLAASKVELEKEREGAAKSWQGLKEKEDELTTAEDLLRKEKEELVGSRLEVTRLKGEVDRVSAEKAGAEARAKKAEEGVADETTRADSAQKQLANERARADCVQMRQLEERAQAERQIAKERGRADCANKLVAEQREQMGVLKAIMDQFAIELKALQNQSRVLGSCSDEERFDAAAPGKEALLGEMREGQALTPQLNRPGLPAWNVVPEMPMQRKLETEGTAKRGEEKHTLGVDIAFRGQNQAVGSQGKNGVGETGTGEARNEVANVASGAVGDGDNEGQARVEGMGAKIADVSSPAVVLECQSCETCRAAALSALEDLERVRKQEVEKFKLLEEMRAEVARMENFNAELRNKYDRAREDVESYEQKYKRY